MADYQITTEEKPRCRFPRGTSSTFDPSFSAFPTPSFLIHRVPNGVYICDFIPCGAYISTVNLLLLSRACMSSHFMLVKSGINRLRRFIGSWSGLGLISHACVWDKQVSSSLLVVNLFPTPSPNHHLCLRRLLVVNTGRFFIHFYLFILIFMAFFLHF